MSVSFDSFNKEYSLSLKGEITHKATLGKDARGNLTRIDNILNQIYDEDINEIQAQQEQIWQGVHGILTKLSKL